PPRSVFHVYLNDSNLYLYLIPSDNHCRRQPRPLATTIKFKHPKTIMPSRPEQPWLSQTREQLFDGHPQFFLKGNIITYEECYPITRAEEDLHYNDWQLLQILWDMSWISHQGWSQSQIRDIRHLLRDPKTQDSFTYHRYIRIVQMNHRKEDAWTQYFEGALEDAKILNEAISRMKQKDLTEILTAKTSLKYLDGEEILKVVASKRHGLMYHTKNGWKDLAPRAFRGREKQLPARATVLAQMLWPDYYQGILDTGSEEKEKWVEAAATVMGEDDKRVR
ncbi:MAG: hypothetical protein Q9183_007451, partial [Haloplaca sp. 2 TL-2023]